MQVSVEKTSELSIKMTVSLPATVVQKKMTARIQSLASQVKVDGFRPGKVPQQVVQKLYGDKVRAEVCEELLKTSYSEALQEQDIVPLGYPTINFLEDSAGLTYTADFEVYPTVSLDALDQLEVTRPVATVEDSDVDIMIEKLRIMRQTWQIVDRPAQTGDRITLSFSVSRDDGFSTGRIDKDDNGNDFTIVIGSNQMIPGFEDNLIGLTTGDNKKFILDFPENYHNTELAGKTANFEVDIIKAEEASPLPEIDEAFIKAYGIEGEGTVESFRDDVRATMARELETALKAQFKEAILASVYQTVQLPVPNALVDQEVQSLAKPYLEQAKKQKIKTENLQLPRDVFEETAKTRVALSLILKEIIEKNNIQVDDEKVRATVENMAQSFERPDEVVTYYYADEKRLNDIKQMVIEDQTVEWLAARAKISDQAMSFSEIMNKHQR